jgi:hypothetical protein
MLALTSTRTESYTFSFKTMSETITLQDLKQKVGQPWIKLDYIIESGMVRKFAEAVGDCNPRWQGKKAEMPPTMLATLGFECAISALMGLDSAVLHGSTDLEVAAPVKVGDTITVTASIAALRERQMPSGNMTFITIQKDYTNQRGEKLASCKQLAIVRQGAP